MRVVRTAGAAAVAAAVGVSAVPAPREGGWEIPYGFGGISNAMRAPWGSPHNPAPWSSEDKSLFEPTGEEGRPFSIPQAILSSWKMKTCVANYERRNNDITGLTDDKVLEQIQRAIRSAGYNQIHVVAEKSEGRMGFVVRLEKYIESLRNLVDGAKKSESTAGTGLKRRSLVVPGVGSPTREFGDSDTEVSSPYTELGVADADDPTNPYMELGDAEAEDGVTSPYTELGDAEADDLTNPYMELGDAEAEDGATSPYTELGDADADDPTNPYMELGDAEAEDGVTSPYTELGDADADDPTNPYMELGNAEAEDGVTSPYTELGDAEADGVMSPYMEFGDAEADSVTSPYMEFGDAEAEGIVSPYTELGDYDVDAENGYYELGDQADDTFSLFKREIRDIHGGCNKPEDVLVTLLQLLLMQGPGRPPRSQEHPGNSPWLLAP